MDADYCRSGSEYCTRICVRYDKVLHSNHDGTYTNASYSVTSLLNSCTRVRVRHTGELHALSWWPSLMSRETRFVSRRRGLMRCVSRQLVGLMKVTMRRPESEWANRLLRWALWQMQEKTVRYILYLIPIDASKAS